MNKKIDDTKIELKKDITEIKKDISKLNKHVGKIEKKIEKIDEKLDLLLKEMKELKESMKSKTVENITIVKALTIVFSSWILCIRSEFGSTMRFVIAMIVLVFVCLFVTI